MVEKDPKQQNPSAETTQELSDEDLDQVAGGIKGESTDSKHPTTIEIE